MVSFCDAVNSIIRSPRVSLRIRGIWGEREREMNSIEGSGAHQHGVEVIELERNVGPCI